MPGTAFSLTVDQVGGHLTIDGVPIPDEHILATEVIAANDRPTRLLVHVAAQGAVTGEAIIETVRDGITGDRIRALNAEAIRTAVSSRLGMGANSAAIYRDVIAEMIDAQAAP